MPTKLVLKRWMIVPLMAVLIVVVGGLDVHALEADPARYFVQVYQEEVAGREQPATDAGLSCAEDTAWATPAAPKWERSAYRTRQNSIRLNVQECNYHARDFSTRR
jgi:hypothetical protein